MRLPFFKDQKPIVAEPKLTLSASLRSACEPTQCIAVQPAQRASREETQRLDCSIATAVSKPERTAPVVPANATAIPLQIKSILSQLPSRLFVVGSERQLTTSTIAIPVDWVLPQLSKGKVAISLNEILPLLPADLLLQPAPLCRETDTITLPLHEVIAALPPESLAVEGQAVVDINAEDFSQLPQLFDDALLEEPVAPEQEPTTVTVEPAAAVESPAPASQAPAPAPVSTGPSICIKMRSLVAVMPDCVFVCPRAELWQIVNPDLPVSLPLEPLIPQLRLARLALPLGTVIEAMPPAMFVRPLPPVQGEIVPLPLPEIIPQLPPAVFAEQIKQTSQETLEINEDDIPTPFEERSPAPAAEATTPPPTPLEPAPTEVPVPAEMFEDENFAVFAEKPPVTAPPPAEFTVQEPAQPEIEPVAVESAPPAVAPVPTTEPVEKVGAVEGTQFLVDLNHCSVEDLQKLHRVGPALARRIIEFRQARGRINSLDELRTIPGIGRKTFRSLAGPDPRRLNRLLGAAHDRELTMQEIVHHLAALPGVEGCILALSDGLLLTGELPAPFDRNTVSVFAPQLFKRIARQTRELEVGDVSHVTIFAERQPMSVFNAGEVYLVIVHNPRRYSKALLHRCKRISREIARLCSSRAIV